MHNQIEQAESMLEPLIRQHGFDKVQKALEPLLASASWPTWQRVSNLVNNINNRIAREATSRIL